MMPVIGTMLWPRPYKGSSLQTSIRRLPIFILLMVCWNTMFTADPVSTSTFLMRLSRTSRLTTIA